MTPVERLREARTALTLARSAYERAVADLHGEVQGWSVEARRLLFEELQACGALESGS